MLSVVSTTVNPSGDLRLCPSSNFDIFDCTNYVKVGVSERVSSSLSSGVSVFAHYKFSLLNYEIASLFFRPQHASNMHSSNWVPRLKFHCGITSWSKLKKAQASRR